MKCFYHGDAEAVAICKSCGRGICHECCAEIGTGAACRNRCEGDVEVINDMIQRNKSSFQKAGSAYTRSGVFLTALGLVFSAVGLYSVRDGHPQWFLLIMGVAFFIYGLSNFGLARRWRAK